MTKIKVKLNKAQFYKLRARSIREFMTQINTQARLFIMCGLPCSGKTTFANKLAKERNATIFSLDKLVLSLFPKEDNFQTHHKYVQRIQQVFFPLAKDLLDKGNKVVMDFPGHTQSERNKLRQIGLSVGVETNLYYLRVRPKTIAARVQKRNVDPVGGEYQIPDWLFKLITNKFEEPSSNENPLIIWTD